MQLSAEQLELQQIRNCSKRSLNIHISVRYRFHFYKHFASHRPDAGRDAGRSSCELFVTVATFFLFSIFDVFYMFRNCGFILRKTVVLTGMVQCVIHASDRTVCSIHKFLTTRLLKGRHVHVLQQ